ncbi:MAG: hypothetical protein ACQESR_14245 [Planctomycetota bacterium]
MERCPTQAVLPLIGLAAEKVTRDRYRPGSVRHAREATSGLAMGSVWLSRHNDTIS